MFIYYLLMFSLFAMIGGILAVAIMNNQKARREKFGGSEQFRGQQFRDRLGIRRFEIAFGACPGK